MYRETAGLCMAIKNIMHAYSGIQTNAIFDYWLLTV